MAKVLLDRLKDRFGASVIECDSFRGDETARVTPAVWKDVARFLRTDGASSCDYFVDLSATDYPDRDETEGGRFEVYLIVYSLAKKHRIRVKARVTERDPVLDTVSDVYEGANWMERECFDMFGVKFRGHPDLRRILMYDEFEGHPLRKDYPAERTQPLVPYREGTHDKLGPFLRDEGMPFNRTPDFDRGGNR